MLDELLERQEYNLSLNQCGENHCFRLKYDTLRNFTGLTRPLTIIAREKLFLSSTPNIQNTKNYLNKWLEDLRESESLQSILLNKNGKYYTKAQEIIDFIDHTREQDENELYKSSVILKNDFNSIALDQIIANALDDGPLKRYCLVAKKDFFIDNQLWQIGRNKGTDLNATHQEYLLKATGAYLVKNKLNQQNVFITDADVINWCSKYIRNEKFYFTNNNEMVFDKLPVFMSSHNTIKYSFHKDWIDNFSFIEIIDDNSINKWHESNLDYKYYYIDKGSAVPLEQHTL